MSSSSNVKAMAKSVNISIVLVRILVLVYPLEYQLNYLFCAFCSVHCNCIVQSIDNAITAHGVDTVDTFILLFSTIVSI